MSIWDTDLACWICRKCKQPFDSQCPFCNGLGSYFSECLLEQPKIVDCDCCGCKDLNSNYSI